jgi:thioredoxin reductase (NADPH)
MNGDERTYDVVIAGGGPAGLSAALLLARACRRVLIADEGRPANARSRAVGGFVGHVGTPAELRRAAREQLAEFESVHWRAGAVSAAAPSGEGIDVTAGGERVQAGALLLATGLHYELPPVPGFEDLWGRSVFHCPFCDGWEVHGRPLATYGNARRAVLLRNWSDDVLLFGDVPDAERERAAAAGVRVRPEPVVAVTEAGNRMAEISFADGPAERRAVFADPKAGQPSDLAERLGCKLGTTGLVEVDPEGRTAVPGVYAAGDCAMPVRSVAIAAGSGSRSAKAMILDALDW